MKPSLNLYKLFKQVTAFKDIQGRNMLLFDQSSTVCVFDSLT